MQARLRRFWYVQGGVSWSEWGLGRCGKATAWVRERTNGELSGQTFALRSGRGGEFCYYYSRSCAGPWALGAPRTQRKANARTLPKLHGKTTARGSNRGGGILRLRGGGE